MFIQLDVTCLLYTVRKRSKLAERWRKYYEMQRKTEKRTQWDDAKYPIFLPGNSEFTELVVKNHHKLVFHNGVCETLNQRTKFWIRNLRNSS